MIPTLMTFFAFFIVLCVVGLILWGIGKIPDLPPVVKTAIYVIVGVVLLLWLLGLVTGNSLGTLPFK